MSVRFDFATSRAASEVECEARVTTSGRFLASQARHCAIACGNDTTVARSSRPTPGRAIQAEGDREVDLALDEEVAVEGQRVEGDRDRPFDHVLDRDDAAVGVAALDCGDHLGDGGVGGAITGREVRLRQQRLFGEGSRRTEIRNLHHPMLNERPRALAVFEALRWHPSSQVKEEAHAGCSVHRNRRAAYDREHRSGAARPARCRAKSASGASATPTR